MHDLYGYFYAAMGSCKKKLIRLCCVASLISGATSLAASTVLANDDLLDLDAEVELELEPIGGITSVCDDHVAAKGWDNPGKPFSVSVGTGIVSVAPGHANYINERQNAYDKAVLEAKGPIPKPCAPCYTRSGNKALRTTSHKLQPWKVRLQQRITATSSQLLKNHSNLRIANWIRNLSGRLPLSRQPPKRQMRLLKNWWRDIGERRQHDLKRCSLV